MSSEKEPISFEPSLLGEKLRLFCEGKGSVRKVADLLGIKPQQLQKYVRGAQKPGAEILGDLKRIGCDIAWLVDDNEPIGFNEFEPIPSILGAEEPRSTWYQRPSVPVGFSIRNALLALQMTPDGAARALNATTREVIAWIEGTETPSFDQLALLFVQVAPMALSNRLAQTGNHPSESVLPAAGSAAR